MKKTKIICTLGPSTDNLALVEEMIKEGNRDVIRYEHMAAMKDMLLG